jgi:hypothetical protein
MMEYKTVATLHNGRLEISVPDTLGDGEVEVTIRPITPRLLADEPWTPEALDTLLTSPRTPLTKEAFLALVAQIHTDDWSHIENSVEWVQQQREQHQMRSAWRWVSPSTD